MKIEILKKKFESHATPLLVVPVLSDRKDFPAALDFLAEQLAPTPQQVFRSEDFTAKKGEKRLLYAAEGGIPRVVLMGVGKKEELNLETVREFFGACYKTAREYRVPEVSIYWEEALVPEGKWLEFLVEAVSALEVPALKLEEWKTPGEDEPPAVEQAHLLLPDAPGSAKEWLEQAEKVAEGVNLARRMANLPSNLLTPERFVEKIKELKKQYGWKLEILDEKELERRGFGALLAVARGSENPPYLVVASYKAPRAKKTVAVVGKGVTFDSGGISLKPSRNMEEMKYDMSGAAVALGTLVSVSATRLPVNLVAAFPLVENLPSGKATRPGDVVKSYSGKSIEVINTDAEGRLILADALSYVEKKYQPDCMVDLATLTGAVVVALGHLAAAVFATEEEYLRQLQEAGDISGERLWPLPLWDEYAELMKSPIADVRNISTQPGAGTITAAKFLQKFVENTPWIHLDIAGTAYNMPEKSYRPKGPTGFGVRLLWYWLKGNHS